MSICSYFMLKVKIREYQFHRFREEVIFSLSYKFVDPLQLSEHRHKATCIISIFKSMVQYYPRNRIGDVMVSVFASSAVDREFEPRSGQTKD